MKKIIKIDEKKTNTKAEMEDKNNKAYRVVLGELLGIRSSEHSQVYYPGCDDIMKDLKQALKLPLVIRKDLVDEKKLELVNQMELKIKNVFPCMNTGFDFDSSEYCRYFVEQIKKKGKAHTEEYAKAKAFRKDYQKINDEFISKIMNIREYSHLNNLSEIATLLFKVKQCLSLRNMMEQLYASSDKSKQQEQSKYINGQLNTFAKEFNAHIDTHIDMQIKIHNARNNLNVSKGEILTGDIKIVTSGSSKISSTKVGYFLVHDSVKIKHGADFIKTYIAPLKGLQLPETPKGADIEKCIGLFKKVYESSVSNFDKRADEIERRLFAEVNDKLDRVKEEYAESSNTSKTNCVLQ